MVTRQTKKGTVLLVRIQPGARRNAVVGFIGDRVKIAVQATATEGKANRAVEDFVAQLLSIPTRSVQIVSGTTTRDKSILIEGKAEEDVRSTMMELGLAK